MQNDHIGVLVIIGEMRLIAVRLSACVDSKYKHMASNGKDAHGWVHDCTSLAQSHTRLHSLPVSPLLDHAVHTAPQYNHMVNCNT